MPLGVEVVGVVSEGGEYSSLTLLLSARVFPPDQFVTTAGVGAFTSNRVNYHHHGVVTVVVAVAVVVAAAVIALQRQRPSRGRPRFKSYQLPARVFPPINSSPATSFSPHLRTVDIFVRRGRRRSRDAMTRPHVRKHRANYW